MNETRRTVVSGPLAPYAAGFTDRLRERGYGQASVASHLRLLADVSRWLGVQGLSAPDLTPGRVDAFVLASRAGGTSGPWARRSFRRLLEYLVSLGIEVRPESLEPLEQLLATYRSYLEDERGLGALTVGGYVRTARDFLVRRGGGDPARLDDLSAADVSRFVLAEAARGLSPRTVNETVVRLRSLLRYFYLLGLISAPLAQATPWMANSRAGSLPRSFDPSVGARLLASCERSTLSGAREFAILSVLVRLGLRAGEIAALSCDDIDWRRGEVVVRGKGGVFDVLPLPADVGESLAFYLERRGKVRCRQVFANVEAPWGALTMTAVRAVVRMACARAGIDDTGTHRFRHAAASELLRRGAALPEIGQLLRHHHLQTTAVYAKVDFEALASVAGPWPGVRP